MKILLAIKFIILANYICAQNTEITEIISFDSSSLITLSGIGEYNSSSIPNNFSSAFIFRKKLTNKMINQSISYLEPNNKFGMDLIGRVDYLSKEYRRGDSSTMRWQYTYRSVFHSDFSISKNLFSLIFKGNKQFAGTNVSLGNNSIQNIVYDNFMLHGISKTVFPNSVQTIGIGGGLILGKQLNSAYINNTNLYTEVNGEFLDISSNYSYYNTSNIPTYYKGYGINVSGFYIVERKKDKFYFSIDNAGFINWNSGGSIYRKDTNIRFEGIEITNIFTSQNSINSDSLVSIVAGKSDSSAFTLPIIPELSFGYEFKINDFFCFHSMVNYRINGNYNPNLIGKLSYNASKSFNLGLLASYGGYGFYNISDKREASVGIETKIELFNNWRIFVQIPHINGLLYPKWLAGNGLLFTLTKKI